MIENEEIVIEVDCELECVIPGFLECRFNDCLLIDNLLLENNLEEISRLGHRLKGTGGSYGFDAISDIGLDLEVAVAQEDLKAIHTARNSLESYLKKVKIVYVSM